MFKLIAVTDQASCPENFWTQLQLLAASEIDALIFRAKEILVAASPTTLSRKRAHSREEIVREAKGIKMR